MGPAVIGAFVGALLAFVLSEVAARARRRREHIETAVYGLLVELPEVLIGYSASASDAFDRNLHSEWWLQRNRALANFTAIRTSARWPLRGRRRIRRAADDLAARFAAAELRFHQDLKLGKDELLDFATADLMAATFRGSRDVGQQVDWYIEHGFQSGKPPETPKPPWWRRMWPWGRRAS